MTKRDKHQDFLKSIRIPAEEMDRKRRIPQTKKDRQKRTMSWEEQLELQKELERCIDELLGSTEE